jgi:alkanesulfonate monooxygenase SsuD/methylene tetrahydromethanopterin reductase-like flavin-dependent oxidoreductase (luciferase family)
MLAASRNIGREAAWRFLKEAEEKNADDKDYIAYAKEKIKNTEDLVWFWETVGAVNIVKLGEMLSRLVPREHKLDVQQQTVIDFSGTPEQVRDRIEQRYRVRLPPTLKLITNKEPEPPTIDANGIEVSES